MGIGFSSGLTHGAEQDLCASCTHNYICKYKEQYQAIRNDIRKESNKLACMSVEFRCNHYSEQATLRNANIRDIGGTNQPYIDAIPTSKGVENIGNGGSGVTIDKFKCTVSCDNN